jgi:hypothetical protein
MTIIRVYYGNDEYIDRESKTNVDHAIEAVSRRSNECGHITENQRQYLYREIEKYSSLPDRQIDLLIWPIQSPPVRMYTRHHRFADPDHYGIFQVDLIQKVISLNDPQLIQWLVSRGYYSKGTDQLHAYMTMSPLPVPTDIYQLKTNDEHTLYEEHYVAEYALYYDVCGTLQDTLSILLRRSDFRTAQWILDTDPSLADWFAPSLHYNSYGNSGSENWPTNEERLTIGSTHFAALMEGISNYVNKRTIIRGGEDTIIALVAKSMDLKENEPPHLILKQYYYRIRLIRERTDYPLNSIVFIWAVIRRALNGIIRKRRTQRSAHVIITQM